MLVFGKFRIFYLSPSPYMSLCIVLCGHVIYGGSHGLPWLSCHNIPVDGGAVGRVVVVVICGGRYLSVCVCVRVRV
jgi:hypothetical protein